MLRTRFAAALLLGSIMTGCLGDGLPHLRPPLRTQPRAVLRLRTVTSDAGSRPFALTDLARFELDQEALDPGSLERAPDGGLVLPPLRAGNHLALVGPASGESVWVPIVVAADGRAAVTHAAIRPATDRRDLDVTGGEDLDGDGEIDGAGTVFRQIGRELFVRDGAIGEMRQYDMSNGDAFRPGEGLRVFDLGWECLLDRSDEVQVAIDKPLTGRIAKVRIGEAFLPTFAVKGDEQRLVVQVPALSLAIRYTGHARPEITLWLEDDGVYRRMTIRPATDLQVPEAGTAPALAPPMTPAPPQMPQPTPAATGTPAAAAPVTTGPAGASEPRDAQLTGTVSGTVVADEVVTRDEARRPGL